MSDENSSTRKIAHHSLHHSIIITTRFSDTDAMQIVWHGNYLKYFEDGREAFGSFYGIRYMDMYANGFTAPIVHLEIDYKRSVSFNQPIRVDVTLMNTPASKLIFQYAIYNHLTNELLCEGKTIQVFLNLTGELQLTNPEFFLEWKRKHGLL